MKHEFERLLNELENEPGDDDYENWRGEPEDTIVGTLVRYDLRETRYAPYWVAVIKTPEGELTGVWISTKNLKKLFEKWKPKPGENLAIRRGEDRQLSTGNAMKTYRLKVDREGPAEPRPEEVPEWLEDSEHSAGPGNSGSQPDAKPEPQESIPF